MLPEIYEEIYQTLKAMPDFNGKGKVGRYHGEFEEGFEWIPVLPSALVLMSNSRPPVKSSSDNILRTVTQIIIFAADRDDSLQLAEDISNALDAAEFEIDQCNYFTSYQSLEFFGYIKQVEIYKITIGVK